MTTGHKSFPLLPANLSKSRAIFLPNSFSKLSQRNLPNLLARPKVGKKGLARNPQRIQMKRNQNSPDSASVFGPSQFSALIPLQLFCFWAFLLTLHLHNPKTRSTFPCLKSNALPKNKQEPQTNFGGQASWPK